MFKYLVEYTDYNGVERKETLYFNLSKAELITLDNSVPGGLGNKMKAVVNSMDNVEIMNYFIKMIKMSYGKKSDDGKRFIKDPELVQEFMETEAYTEFLMKVLTEDDFATKFITGILPDVSEKELEQARKELEKEDALVAEGIVE